MTTGNMTLAQQARLRARAARAELDRDRAARDKAIEQAAALVFTGMAQREAAAAAAEAALDTMAGGLRALLGAGVSTVQVAQVCGLAPAVVQRLTKRATPAAAPTGPTPEPARHAGADRAGVETPGAPRG